MSLYSILDKLTDDEIIEIANGVEKGHMLRYIASKRNERFKNGIPNKFQTTKDIHVMQDIVTNLIQLKRYDIIEKEHKKSKSFFYQMLTCWDTSIQPDKEYVKNIVSLAKRNEFYERDNHINSVLSVSHTDSYSLEFDNHYTMHDQCLFLAYRYYVSNDHDLWGTIWADPLILKFTYIQKYSIPSQQQIFIVFKATTILGVALNTNELVAYDGIGNDVIPNIMSDRIEYDLKYFERVVSKEYKMLEQTELLYTSVDVDKLLSEKWNNVRAEYAIKTGMDLQWLTLKLVQTIGIPISIIKFMITAGIEEQLVNTILTPTVLTVFRRRYTEWMRLQNADVQLRFI